jgi:hypothetical protein
MILEDPRMSKRLTSAILLALLAVTVALPIQAGGMMCRMDRAAPAPACNSCDLASLERTVPSVSAGSCCRFEAPKDVASSPVLLGATSKSAVGSDASDFALADLGVSPTLDTAARSAASGETRARSSTSGNPQSTVLRL